MLLAEIVAASRDVAATRARSAKIERLAACLRAATPDEVPAIVSWLAGELPHGRIGAGWAALRAATSGVAPAREARLTVAEVDAAIGALATLRGAGSGRSSRAPPARSRTSCAGCCSASCARARSRAS